MDKQNKHPVDNGEVAAAQASTECAQEETERLSRRVPIRYLVELHYVTGNPFMHPDSLPQ